MDIASLLNPVSPAKATLPSPFAIDVKPSDDKKDTASPVANLNFLGFPPEIRFNVYNHIFGKKTIDLATIHQHPIFNLSLTIRDEALRSLFATKTVIITFNKRYRSLPVMEASVLEWFGHNGACLRFVEMRYTYGTKGYSGEMAEIRHEKGRFEMQATGVARSASWAKVRRMIKGWNGKHVDLLSLWTLVKVAKVLNVGPRSLVA